MNKSDIILGETIVISNSRKRGPQRPCIVTDINRYNKCRLKYCDTEIFYNGYYDGIHHLKTYEGENMKNKLYCYYDSINDVMIYGKIIATNEHGLKVFEEKGTGNIHLVDQKVLKEVVPDIVSFVDIKGKTHSYINNGTEFNNSEIYVIENIGIVSLTSPAKLQDAPRIDLSKFQKVSLVPLVKNSSSSNE